MAYDLCQVVYEGPPPASTGVAAQSIKRVEMLTTSVRCIIRGERNDTRVCDSDSVIEIMDRNWLIGRTGSLRGWCSEVVASSRSVREVLSQGLRLGNARRDKLVAADWCRLMR